MDRLQLLNLIKNAKEKDQKSQTSLINMFWVDVFSFVVKKVQDENLADEITVNVFSKVLSRLDKYDVDFQFKTWVLTIAQNTIIDFWRKRNKEAENAGMTMEEVSNEFEKSPEELLIIEEDSLKIQQIVENMDAKYAEIIRLRFFEELSIKEIAEKLQLSVSNTKVRIMRAKKVLIQLLKENDIDIED